MAIRNYTSKISPNQTAGKMQKLLAEHDARRVSIEYGDNGDPQAVTFQMDVEGRPLWFRIAPDVRGMLKAMEDDDGVPSSRCNEEQAARTAWKNKYDWLDAQLAEVASNQARLEQLLLGFGVTDDGRTVYERLEESGRLLNAPRADALPENSRRVG